MSILNFMMRKIDSLVTHEYHNSVFIRNEFYYFCGKISGWCTRRVLMYITIINIYIEAGLYDEVNTMSDEDSRLKPVTIKEEHTKKRKLCTQKGNNQKKQTIVSV